MATKAQRLDSRADEFGLVLQSVGWSGWALYVPALAFEVRDNYPHRPAYILKNLDAVKSFLDDLEQAPTSVKDLIRSR